MIFGKGKIRLVNSRLGVDIIVGEINISKKKTDNRAYLSKAYETDAFKMFSYGQYISRKIKLKYVSEEMTAQLKKLEGSQDTIVIPHIDFNFSFTAIISLVERYYDDDLYYKKFILIELESRFIIDHLFFGLNFIYRETPSGTTNVIYYNEFRDDKSVGYINDGRSTILKSDLNNDKYISVRTYNWYLGGGGAEWFNVYDNSVINLDGLNPTGLSILPTEIVTFGSTYLLNIMLRYNKDEPYAPAVPTDLGALVSDGIKKAYCGQNGVAWLYIEDKLRTFHIDTPSVFQEVIIGNYRDFCLLSDDEAIIYYTSGNMLTAEYIQRAQIVGGILQVASSITTKSYRVRSCCKYRDGISLSLHFDGDAGIGYLRAIKDGEQLAIISLGGYGASVWVDHSDIIYISQTTQGVIKTTTLDKFNNFEPLADIKSVSTEVKFQDPFGYELKRVD